MFTGIIEELGRIRRISTQAGLKEIEVAADKVLADLKVRDSLSVNGVCLTVVRRNLNFCTFEVVNETLKETNLGKLKSGDKVNLERAVKVAERLGGHLVSGHIDGLAKLVKRQKISKADYLWFKIDSKLSRQIVKKGSITLEGVSLTVAEIKSNLFKVALIPYTLKETTLGGKRVGDELNLELDCLGKYVYKYLEGTTGHTGKK